MFLSMLLRPWAHVGWTGMRVGAQLDVLQWSQLPGHHCLKCVSNVQYVYMCMCLCVHPSLCVYMGQCPFRRQKSREESICWGCFTIHEAESWVMATALDSDMTSTEKSSLGLSSSLKQLQLCENNLWKMAHVTFLAALYFWHIYFLLLWCHKALGVYLQFGTCTFPFLFLL